MLSDQSNKLQGRRAGAWAPPRHGPLCTHGCGAAPMALPGGTHSNWPQLSCFQVSLQGSPRSTAPFHPWAAGHRHAAARGWDALQCKRRAESLEECAL